MKDKGFALYELLISMSFLAILLISMFSTVYSLNKKLADIYINNQINDKKAIIYKKIAGDFNLKNIKYKGSDNDYTLEIYGENDNTMEKAYEKKVLKIENNGQRLVYGSSENSSDIIDLKEDVIKIKSIKITEKSTDLSLNNENYENYLKLTITFEFNDTEDQMNIYCINATGRIS